MDELYRDILNYASNRGKELVFADATSSINPLAGNHTKQIEPNERGSILMGRLIGRAINYSFPAQTSETTAIIRMSEDGKHFQDEQRNEAGRARYEVKKIHEFISHNRYKHLHLLFSPSSDLQLRYESTYHLVMGKHFDMEYRGLFAFGLLDLSLITVLASYLWRVVINEEAFIPLRVAAGVVAVPTLIGKAILGLSLILALALPVSAYHLVASCFSDLDKEDDLSPGMSGAGSNH